MNEDQTRLDFKTLPTTSQEEIVEGTFLCKAGDEESGIAKWLNTVTRAMLSLHPTWAATPGMVTHSNSILPCSWSSKTLHKPILDGPMSLKPDLILWKTPDALPQQEFSWKGVISFIELTSVAYS